jgi:flagellar protein FliS
MQHQANFQAAQAYRQRGGRGAAAAGGGHDDRWCDYFLQKSVRRPRQKKFEESHALMIRATAILRGLSHNLNFDRREARSRRACTPPIIR